jgi:hypothetical protein
MVDYITRRVGPTGTRPYITFPRQPNSDSEFAGLLSPLSRDGLASLSVRSLS